MNFYTPLRYPGGKGKLSTFMKSLIVENDLSDGTYYEPYCGGAAVAMHLLLEDFVWDIVINDADPAVYAFWHAVLYDAENLSRMIVDTAVNMDQWNRQKIIYGHPDNHSTTDLAFATFFLNRTNRSGILMGGVIGGKDQTGPYKIDARFNKANLIERIELINSFADRISVHNLDAVKFLRTEIDNANEKSIIYLDPPYYNKGSQLYKNYYKHDDHLEISKIVLEELKIPWLVTYDNMDAINEMYKGALNRTFSLTYSAHTSRPKGTEVLFYKGLCLPDGAVFEPKSKSRTKLQHDCATEISPPS